MSTLKLKYGKEYVEVKSGDKTLRLFRSMSPARLVFSQDEFETFDEYKLRRRFIKEVVKKHGRGKLARIPVQEPGETPAEARDISGLVPEAKG